MSPWIDFKSLRRQLSFAAVLKHYGVEAKVKGDRAVALCPLPNHPARAGGGKRTASLSIHLTRNLFQCFGCHASGNVLDFAAYMEKLDPNDPAQLRQAAALMQERFGLTHHSGGPAQTPALGKMIPSSPAKPKAGRENPPVRESSPPMEDSPKMVVVNAPLDFELKHLDPAHPYLMKRGLTPETIAHFGLGFCGKGMMKDRIAIPLHDAEGHLIGYAGRLVDEEQISDDHPKYLFPGPREREGKRFEFHKSQFLYNGSGLTLPANDLVVVEGFASVWWLWQNGYESVAALMGSRVSEAQADLLCRGIHPDSQLWIFTDGDEAGERCAQDLSGI